MTNIVYVLTNPAMPGIVKIGMTDDLQRRLSQLYNTSVPVQFECVSASGPHGGGHRKRVTYSLRALQGQPFP